ncbi:MAG TPA: M56 family metallopeptidase [Bryobacteraceae bacterium]|nr:M56 family metallopeptidase [Bryobacteraceae bacterium]
MINHLWQSTAFAGCVALLALVLRNHRASARYALWFSASVKFLVPFSFFMSLGRRVEPAMVSLAPAIAATAKQIAVPFRGTILASRTPVPIDWTPWIFAAWAAGVLAIMTMRVRAWFRIRLMARTSRRHSMRFPVEVRTSAGMLEPGLVGLWRCTVLLPEGIESYLTPRQLDAVLTHELCHARRRDNLLAAVHMVVEALFWFHPLVWWIGARLAETRELACDEAVLARGGDPGEYAEAILTVCRRYVESPLACVSGMTSADLKKRIEAILSCRPIHPINWGKKSLLAAVMFIALVIPFLAGVTNAQSAKSFEVASVRLADRNGSRPIIRGLPPRMIGDRFEYTATVHSLIVCAYSLINCQNCDFVVGGPSWTREDLYRIVAKLPEGAPRYNTTDFESGQAEAVYQMIRSLLADRFRLKVRQDTKEVSTYMMVEEPGGHRLRASEGKTRQYSDGTTRPDRRLGIVPLYTQGGVQMLRMTVTNFTTHELADALSGWFDRPVMDRTGVKGRFDFAIEYGVEQGETSSRPTPVGPELIATMRKQLGLRLESKKAAVDVVVIDSIERPTDN